jgi:hypothetical protein
VRGLVDPFRVPGWLFQISAVVRECLMEDRWLSGRDRFSFLFVVLRFLFSPIPSRFVHAISSDNLCDGFVDVCILMADRRCSKWRRACI